MGTRNSTIVIQDGLMKVAQYGQWDGYPAGAGFGILDFLKDVNMDAFREGVSNCTEFTDAEIEKGVLIADNPHLSRDVGYGILELITDANGLKLHSDTRFVADSLFCEWAYVIDLDKNKLEVYEGFNQKPLPNNARFKNMEHLSERGYYPVKKVCEFKFDELPTTKSERELFGEEKFRKVKREIKERVSEKA
jgi:hypothetical protein